MTEQRVTRPGIWRRALLTAAVATAVSGLAVPVASQMQIPEEFTNLHYYPQDISRDSLIQVMRGFSFALGVRCSYCHARVEGEAGLEFDFASDDDANKRKARWMLQLVDELNDEILPEMLDRDTPATTVQCVTCHHGLGKPQTLQMALWDAIEGEGVDAAVDLYGELREDYFGLGAYDFGEWEMNELARKLGAAGLDDAAIAMLLLNDGHHPDSPSIQYMLGELYEKTGDTDAAVARYERTLEILPDHGGAQARLEALRGG